MTGAAEVRVLEQGVGGSGHQGSAALEALASTLVPPPLAQHLPHPPPAHSLAAQNDLVLEGQVWGCLYRSSSLRYTIAQSAPSQGSALQCHPSLLQL